MELIKTLFWVSRPVSWINTAYPFIVAYLLSGGSNMFAAIVGTLYFLIPYNLMMYGINDVFDYESDLRNPRKGGIEGALLDRKWHKLVIRTSVIGSVPFLMLLTLLGTSASTSWLYFCVFTVIAYSAKGLRFKEKPFLDSLTSASHFVGPMIFGLSLAGADLTEPKLLNAILAFTLWGVASHAFGAVQDVLADRQGGISSIATAIGARATVRFAFISYLISAIFLIFAGQPIAYAAVAIVPYLAIVGRFWNITDATCERANSGWKVFIWLNFFAGAVVTLLVIS